MYPRILEQIRALVKRGDYVLSIHAENEMAEDGLTDQDVEVAILNGRIVRRERDRIGRPKYVIEGTAMDGRSLMAVAHPFRLVNWF
jgi:hypothetical protein